MKWNGLLKFKVQYKTETYWIFAKFRKHFLSVQFYLFWNTKDKKKIKWVDNRLSPGEIFLAITIYIGWVYTFRKIVSCILARALMVIRRNLGTLLMEIREKRLKIFWILLAMFQKNDWKSLEMFWKCLKMFWKRECLAHYFFEWPIPRF